MITFNPMIDEAKRIIITLTVVTYSATFMMREMSSKGHLMILTTAIDHRHKMTMMTVLLTCTNHVMVAIAAATAV